MKKRGTKGGHQPETRTPLHSGSYGIPAELRGCVEVERWEGLPKVSAASDYRNASDVCRPPLELTAVFHANSISIITVEIFVAFEAG